MIWIQRGQNNVDFDRPVFHWRTLFLNIILTPPAGQAKIQKRREAINSSPGFYVCLNPYLFFVKLNFYQDSTYTFTEFARNVLATFGGVISRGRHRETFSLCKLNIEGFIK